jgi:hypothetical protein
VLVSLIDAWSVSGKDTRRDADLSDVVDWIVDARDDVVVWIVDARDEAGELEAPVPRLSSRVAYITQPSLPAQTGTNIDTNILLGLQQASPAATRMECRSEHR